MTHAADVVYVAYSHPYTYTDLNRYLRDLETDPTTSKRFRRRPLCETLAGNTVEMLTVTSFTAEPEAIRRRKGVVISARVHPGESNASWMMEGIIEFLTGPSLDAKILRAHARRLPAAACPPPPARRRRRRERKRGAEDGRGWQRMAVAPAARANPCYHTTSRPSPPLIPPSPSTPHPHLFVCRAPTRR